jgi:hypothetical protein
MALLNFIASNDNKEFCIDDICSSSDIMFDISSEKNHAFVIDFFILSKFLWFNNIKSDNCSTELFSISFF